MSIQTNKKKVIMKKKKKEKMIKIQQSKIDERNKRENLFKRCQITNNFFIFFGVWSKGTGVNVGCIPKKLMYQPSLLGESVMDVKAIG